MQPQRRALADGQAFFERYAPADVRAESAGSDPAHEIWPAVVEAMPEVGIDLAGRKPQAAHRDAAARRLGGHDGLRRRLPLRPDHGRGWDIPDPAGRPLDDVRAIRDGIEAQVRELIDTKLDAIYADRTAHELRLAKLLAPLVEEFAAQHSAEEIRGCADAILDRYDDAPVRSYTTILATRQARECLREDTCDALGSA